MNAINDSAPKIIHELKKEWEKIAKKESEQKARKTEIKAALFNAYAAEVIADWKKLDKQSGTQTMEVEGVRLKFEKTRKVAWDSAVLRKIGETLEEDIINNLFEIKISVPEVKFGALVDPKLKAALEKARTVEYGNPTLSFE